MHGGAAYNGSSGHLKGIIFMHMRKKWFILVIFILRFNVKGVLFMTAMISARISKVASHPTTAYWSPHRSYQCHPFRFQASAHGKAVWRITVSAIAGQSKQTGKTFYVHFTVRLLLNCSTHCVTM